MRIVGRLEWVNSRKFYATLAYVEGYKGENGYILVELTPRSLQIEGISAEGGWFLNEDAVQSVAKEFLLLGKRHQLPVYRVARDGKLSLKSSGVDRIFTAGNSLASLHIVEINSVGELLVEEVNLPKLLKKQDSSSSISFISGADYASITFRDALVNKLGEMRGVLSGEDEFSMARNVITQADCSMLEYIGLDTCLVGFSRCATGVCCVLNRINYARISIASMVEAGVSVLDLSRCTVLKGFKLTGGENYSNPVTIIFNEKLNARVSSDIQITDANVRFVGLKYVSNLEARDSRIDGISEITFNAPRNRESDFCCLAICDCAGFDSLRINVGDSAFNSKSSIAIAGIDAKELVIKMHEKKTEPEDFKIVRCAELESLTIDGAGEWYLSDLITRIRLLPKLKRASFDFTLFNIDLLDNKRGVVVNLSLGSTVLESLRICSDYSMDEYSRNPEIWCDSRVKLELPSALLDCVTVKEFTDEERFLLAFTCRTSALKRNNGEIILDLLAIRDWDSCDYDGWDAVKRSFSLYPEYTRVDGELAIHIPKGIVSLVESNSVWDWKRGTGCRVYLGDERLDKDW